MVNYFTASIKYTFKNITAGLFQLRYINGHTECLNIYCITLSHQQMDHVHEEKKEGNQRRTPLHICCILSVQYTKSSNERMNSTNFKGWSGQNFISPYTCVIIIIICCHNLFIKLTFNVR
jgi:hypothetical protein